MEDHQKQFLITAFQGLLDDLSTDYGPDGKLGPGNAHDVSCLRPLIAWLRGKRKKPGPNGREFLEERLAAFEIMTGWEVLAYEHDALVAAIGDLR